MMALGVDTRTYRRMDVSIQVPALTREQLQPVVDRLAARGIDVTVSGSCQSAPSDSDDVSLWINSAMRHVDAVHVELEKMRHHRRE